MTTNKVQSKGNLDPTRLFENLLTLDQFIEKMNGAFSKATVYGWITNGMPHKKIRGRLFFVPDSFVWLERTSQ